MKEKLKKLKLLVLDVDGVLTDGKLYYNENGEFQKVFNVKDGFGIKIIKNYLNVAIISGNHSSIILKRAKDLKIKHCFLGIEDKKKCITELSEQLSIKKNEIMFMGDDLNDLKVKDSIGIFVCPADSHFLVKEKSDIVTKNLGGQGAVREIIDLILEEKNLIKEYKDGINSLNI